MLEPRRYIDQIMKFRSMLLAVNTTKSQAVLAIVCQKLHSFFDVIAEGGGETDVLKSTPMDQYIE